MLKNKSSKIYDREYIVPAPIEDVVASIRALKNDGDAWHIHIQKIDTNHYHVMALQANPHLAQHLVGVQGRILRYEDNHTRIQLNAHSDKTRLLQFLWWIRVFTPILAIFPVFVLSQYLLLFGYLASFWLILIGLLPALYMVFTMMREGVREREMIDNTLAKANIVMDYLQDQHTAQFGQIITIERDPMPDTSRLSDDDLVQENAIHEPLVQVRNNRR